jgi:hypothetical protein
MVFSSEVSLGRSQSSMLHGCSDAAGEKSGAELKMTP